MKVTNKINNNLLTTLSTSPFFQTLAESEYLELLKIVEIRTFLPDEVIFDEGDSSDNLCIVGTGKVKISRFFSSGKEFVIGFMGAGEIIGACIISKENYAVPVQIVAVDETVLLFIKKNLFLELLRKSPAIAFQIINVLLERLYTNQNRLIAMAGETAEHRLIRMLLMLSSKMGDELPFTRQELADMTGITIETTIRITSRLKKRGFISSKRGKVVILDKRKLLDLSRQV